MSMTLIQFFFIIIELISQYLQEFKDNLVHYIDDGPLFDNLERLVEHYHRTKDGLITTLSYALSVCMY